MSRLAKFKFVASYVIAGLPWLMTQAVFADSTTSGSVSNVESFIKSVIVVIAGLAGLVATGFLVVGGFHYITSSGNPEHLEKAKRTIMYSCVGLAITIGAFVLSNIVTTLASNAFGS